MHFHMKEIHITFLVGVAENMDDSQQIMNGHARMAIDNLAMAGSLVFDVDESALVGGQNMKSTPEKYLEQAGCPDNPFTD